MIVTKDITKQQLDQIREFKGTKTVNEIKEQLEINIEYSLLYNFLNRLEIPFKTRNYIKPDTECVNKTLNYKGLDYKVGENITTGSGIAQIIEEYGRFFRVKSESGYISTIHKYSDELELQKNSL